jgi:uncharacterized protein YcfJ
MKRHDLLSVLCLLAMSLMIVGCETKAQSGALVGGGAGAGLGAIIGHQSGRAGTGALIGGAVGAAGGYMVGNEMDKKDEREQRAYERSAQDRRYQEPPPPAGVSRRDVIAWSRQGLSDDIIIDRIERSRSSFRLTAADENELRDNNVSEDVIRAMKNSGR